MPDVTRSTAGSKATNTDPRYSQADHRRLSRPVGRVVPRGREADRLGRSRSTRWAEAGLLGHGDRPVRLLPHRPRAPPGGDGPARGFRVVAGTGWGILHQAEAWADTEAALPGSIGETPRRRRAPSTSCTCLRMFRDEKTGRLHRRPRALDRGVEPLHQPAPTGSGRIIKEDYGLKMVLHPHGDSHIETPDDIDRIFQATDPEYVGFCLDTGSHRLRRRRPGRAVPEVPRPHLVRPHQGDGPGPRASRPTTRTGRSGKAVATPDARSTPPAGAPGHARPRRGAGRPRQGALRGLRAGHVPL